MSLTRYSRNQLLTSLLSSTVYVSLHSANPGDTGASEVTDANYARQAATFNVDSSTGVATLSNALTWPASSGAYQVTHIGIWDSESGGNCMFRQALNTTENVEANGIPTFAAGEITVGSQA